MFAASLPSEPWLAVLALVLAVLAMAAIGGARIALHEIGRYMAADQGEPSPDVSPAFVDTAAAIASQPATLSELERVDQVLNMPPDYVRRSWDDPLYAVPAPAPLPRDAVAVVLPQPDAYGNACSCDRSDLAPLPLDR